MLSKLWRSWFGSSPRRGASAVRKRPRLEVLEDRRVPTTFTVSVGTDFGGANGSGSGDVGDLRYCIGRANTAGSGADTIQFAPGVSTVSLNGSAGHGTLMMSDPRGLTIQGPPGTETIQGDGTFGIFQVMSGNVHFNDLRVTRGGGSLGGGLVNLGTAILVGCTFDHDTASAVGGAIATGNGSTTVLYGCTIDHNTAQDGGGIYAGGIASRLTMIDCTLDSNTAVNGGGLYLDFAFSLPPFSGMPRPFNSATLINWVAPQGTVKRAWGGSRKGVQG